MKMNKEKKLWEAESKELQAEFEKVEQKIEELDLVVEDIKEIHKVKKNSESWTPIHNGIFVNATIKYNKIIFLIIKKSK